MPRLSIALLLVLVSFVACKAGAPTGQASTAEWLTASATQIEFRSVAYSSKGELLAGLRASQPFPTEVDIRWVASGNKPAERQAAIAQAAAGESGVRVSGVVGNEIFVPARGASSGHQ